MNFRGSVTPKILIVDDEAHLRNLLAISLSERGFSVSTASTGEEALREISRERPSLILLDLLLPEMTGEEVCRFIKEDPDLRKIIVMILSAKADLRTKLACLEMGAEEYLVKPVEVEELVARVRRFLLMTQEIHRPQVSVESTAPTIHMLDPNATWIPHEKTQPTMHAPDESPVSVMKSASRKPIDPVQEPKSNYGGYRVEALAGVGGMGLVYKAYDEVLDRYVAVKVLSKGWSDMPEFLAQFHKEARLIASINHPRIAPVYTFGKQDEDSYFALQWCSGGSLSDLIKRNGKIDLMQAIDFVLQCTRGLEAAHLKGVVHRDIKPSNIMFDESQYIKIVDFGVAFKQTVDQSTTDHQPVLGSPSYMAPEQGKGEATDHRTDIYSLGITFYQMLYGRLPFSAKSPLEWIRAHVEHPFPPYHDLEGKIPRKAYDIIYKMTQKSPDNRYQNYPDLIRELEQLRNVLYSQRRFKIPVIAKTQTGPVLTKESFFDLLTTLFHQQRTGYVKASWGQLQKTFLILRNEIVGFESPQADENFWTEMVKRKFMKNEYVPLAGENLEESLNRLLFLQACALEDFKAVYREMMTRSLVQTFQWPAFHGEFYQAQIENEPFSRISIHGILMAAARALVPFETVANQVPRTQPLVRTSQFENIITSLNLPKTENFLASRIEGEAITIENLQWLTGLSEEQISRTVYAWIRMGALEYRTPVERKSRPKAPELPPQAPAAMTQAPGRVTEPVPVASTPPPKEEKPKKKETDPKQPSTDVQTATKFFEMAQAYYDAGKFWEAERNCVEAIRNNPVEGKYHHLMAKALIHHSHSLKVVEESFRHAIKLDPKNLRFRLDLVHFLKDHDRFEDALAVCDEILAIGPYTPEVIKLRKQIASVRK